MLPLAGHIKIDDALWHIVFDGELCVTNLGHDNDIFVEIHNYTRRLKVGEAKNQIDQHHMSCTVMQIVLPLLSTLSCGKSFKSNAGLLS